MLTRDQLIDLLRRTTDEGWLNPLLDSADGAAVLNALADVVSRVSIAGDHACEAGLISTAPGGRPATVEVLLTRAAGPGGTLPKGMLFNDARNAVFVTTADVPIPVGAASIPVVLQSVRRTEALNTVDEPEIFFAPFFLVADASNTTPIVLSTTRSHGFSSGDFIRVMDVTGNTAANGVFAINVLSAGSFELLGSVGNGVYQGGGTAQPTGGADLSTAAKFQLQVSATTPITGGASDYLSVHGIERSLYRQLGEDDGAYRARIRNIPDAVSPQAIGLVVQGTAQQQALPPFVVQEPFEDGSTASLDQRLGLGSFATLFWDNDNPGTASNPFGYSLDDPAEAAIIVGTREASAYFRVLSLFPPMDPDGVRFFFDDGFWDDPVYGFLDILAPPGMVDLPQHPILVAGLMAIWNAVNTKRAAGVQFDIVIDIDQVIPCPGGTGVVGSGDANTVGDAVVWAATPPATKVWWVQDTVSGHIAAPPSTYVAAATHKLRFTFEDATTHTTAAFAGNQGSMYVTSVNTPILAMKRVTMIEGILASTGGQTQRLLAALRVVEASV